MVRRLEDERVGLRFTEACSPQGSEAVMDPRRAESRRERVGPSKGL